MTRGPFRRGNANRFVHGRPRGFNSGGVPYDPFTEGGLFADAYAAERVTEAGTGVSSWIEGVSLVDIIQAADANRPTFEPTGLGGKPSILWVRANGDVMSGPVLDSSVDWTVICAVDPVTVTPGEFHYLLDTSGTRRIIEVKEGTTDKVAYWDGAHKGIAAATTGPQVLRWVLESGVGGEIFRDGVSLGSSTWTGGGSTTAVKIGGSENLNARIGRLMWFNTLDAERDARVEAWMFGEYSI